MAMLDPLLLETSGGSGGDGGKGGGNGGNGEPEPTPSPQEGTPEPQVGGDDKDQMVPKSELSKANREAAKHRTELRKAQEKIAELEGQSKSELEKANDKVTKTEEDNKALVETNRRLRVQVLAGRVGIVPEAREDAARLLDWDQIADPEDDASVEAALKSLTDNKRYLLGNVPGGGDGGAGGDRQPSGSGDMNRLLRQAAGRGG